jgi:hypothetical protein
VKPVQPHAARVRSAQSLVEILLAIGIIAIVVGPLMGMCVGSSKTTHGSAQRTVLEIRAREIQSALIGTPYATLTDSSKAAIYEPPADLPSEPGYAELVTGCVDVNHVNEVEPGLAKVRTQTEWNDAATRQTQQIVVQRLVNKPTTSMEARYPLTRHGD